MSKLTKKLSELSYQDFNHLTDSKTDQAISELFYCTKNNVGYYRRKLGVKSYGEKHNIVVGVKGTPNPTNRKHFFNERFFACIDTEIKAYALGLFTADGHLTKKMHRARFSLKASDANVLYAIAEAMNYPKGVTIAKEQLTPYGKVQMALININSSTLCKDLVALGLSTSKNNHVMPVLENKLFYRHWLRGLIDGDGHIGSYKNSSVNRRFELSARCEMLQSINSMLQDFDFPVMQIKKQRSICKGNGKFEVLEWAYDNASIYVERKMQAYLNLKAHLSLD